MTVVLSLVFVFAGKVHAGDYNPLAVDPTFHAMQVDLSFHDKVRGRDIPLRIYLPTNTAPEPVVLFSHGLGGSRAAQHFHGRGLGGARLCGRVRAASGQRRFSVEGRAAIGTDAGDETGGFAGEFYAAGAGRSGGVEPVGNMECGQNKYSRRAAGHEKNRNVGSFVRRGHDGSGERRKFGVHRPAIHRFANQGGHRVQSGHSQGRQSGEGFWFR